MNEYMKQAFALCGGQYATVEAVMQTFDDGAAFCRMLFDCGKIAFPLNVDMNDYFAVKCGIGDKMEFNLALFCKSAGEIFENEEEYSSEYDGRFASESIVPYGMMGKNGKQDCAVRVHGKIISVQNVDIDGVASLHIRVACLGYVFDAFFDNDMLPFARVDNIICCIYDAIGIASTARRCAIKR